MKHSVSYHNLPADAFARTEKLIDDHWDKLNDYVDFLLWWNKKVNLVSRDVSRETVMQHVRHSLLVSTCNAFAGSDLVVDAGTGGGLPGIPLAIIRPEKKFILNDVVSKKVMAVRQMNRKLSISNIDTSEGSIEELQVSGKFMLVSKHAFKINELLRFVSHLSWTCLVLFKSIHFKKELEGIDIPLNINALKLYPNSSKAFYKGKGMLIIER